MNELLNAEEGRKRVCLQDVVTDMGMMGKEVPKMVSGFQLRYWGEELAEGDRRNRLCIRAYHKYPESLHVARS